MKPGRIRSLLSPCLSVVCLSLPVTAGFRASAKVARDSAGQSLAVGASLDTLMVAHLADINADSIAKYMRVLSDFGTRFMLADNRRDIATWVADRFRSFGSCDVSLDSFRNTLEFPPGSGQMHATWQYNVIASLDGTATADTVLVLGAHYDDFIMGPNSDPYTLAPGANNNASGVSVCLEVARVIAGQEFRPRYTIHFVAFGAEEFMTMLAEGQTGSEHYVEQMRTSGRHLAMMIDNNQVSCRPSPDDWRLDFQNCRGSEGVTQLAHSLAGRYTRLAPVDTSDHVSYSDVYYFWSQGYPAIFFEEYNFCPHVFTADDVPEKHDPVYGAEVAKLALAMLLYGGR